MKKYLPLFLLILLGTTLRVYHNVDISLWHDEAFSALLIKYPWQEMFYRIGLDVHPPAYYIFLRLWHYIFGDSLWSLRGFSIFFSAALIPLSYEFVRAAFKNGRAALWAALLIALNPFQIQFVTEARMYTMGAFFALLAGYFLMKALNAETAYYGDEKLNMPHLPQDRKLRRSLVFNYLGFALATSIIIYTHYYLLFTAAALGGFALIYHFRRYGGQFKKYGYMLGSFALISLLYLPWLKTFLFQFSQVSAAYWIPRMDKWSIPATIWQMLFGNGVDITRWPQQVLVVTATLFALYALYRLVKNTGRNGWLVAVNVLGPFVGALAFAALAAARGESSSVFLVRYFLFAATFLTIALAVWLQSIRPQWWARTLLIIYCLVSLGAFAKYWKDLDIAHKPGMAGAAKFLAANVEPQHKLYIGTSFEFFNLKYYINQYFPDVRPCENCPALPASQPQPLANSNAAGILDTYAPKPLLYSGGSTKVSDLPHFAGTALLTDADLLPDFAAATKPGDTVWLLWTNAFGSNKPAVPQNWTQIDEKGFAEVRPYPGTWVVVTEYKVN